jgi:hypothetical protein
MTPWNFSRTLLNSSAACFVDVDLKPLSLGFPHKDLVLALIDVVVSPFAKLNQLMEHLR